MNSSTWATRISRSPRSTLTTCSFSGNSTWPARRKRTSACERPWLPFVKPSGCPATDLEIAEGNLPALIENLDKDALISQALSLRGEMSQVLAADQVTELEIRAQGRVMSPSAKTFAAGSDLHANRCRKASPIPTIVRGRSALRCRPSLLATRTIAWIGPAISRTAPTPWYSRPNS